MNMNEYEKRIGLIKEAVSQILEGSSSESTQKRNMQRNQLKAYNLPIELIQQIKDNANEKTGGNQSEMLRKLLRGELTLD